MYPIPNFRIFFAEDQRIVAVVLDPFAQFYE
jgi:hypothetical protein